MAEIREAGVPASALRAYLEGLGMPRHDVRLDVARLRRHALDTLAALGDDELAAATGVPVEFAPALRGARDLSDARALAAAVAEPGDERPPEEAGPSLERLAQLLRSTDAALDEATARELVSRLRGDGADLRALRLALTGRARGPELWSVLRALPRDEALRRIERALAR